MNTYPLSPMQQGLLYHALADPTAYVVEMRYEIEGAFDIDAFRRAWELLFRRHPILRTSFTHDAQTVHDDRGPEITIDAGDPSRVFDLQRDTLMRFHLTRVSDRKHQLIWTYHHLLLDGWCLGILQRELFTAYAAFVAGETPSLPPARPYRDYIDWLSQQDQNAAREYWTQRLEGFETITRVPALASKNSEAREHILQLDEDATRALRDLAMSARVTLNTLVQAAWAIVLARYNDTDDVAFGAIVSGRPDDLEDAETIVGLFINAIPVRVTLDEDEPFDSLLRRMQLDAAQSAPFHHVPLSDLGRDLFDHVLVFDNYPDAEGGDDELSIRATEVHDRTHYAFSLVVVPGRTLQVRFLYDTVRYADDHVQRIASHVETTLRAVIARPSMRVRDIPILSTGEQLAIAASESRPAKPRKYTNVVEWLESQRDRLPVLHARADTIATRLEPGTLVGVLLPRGEEAIATILGILKAGAAYVPIDPEYPQSRIELLSKQCDVVLCSDGRLGRRPVDGGHRNTHLAYVLHTSGSTGTPKPVAITRDNLLHYLGWAASYYGDGDYPLFTSLSFDLTVTSLFLPLLHGRMPRVFAPELDTREVLDEIFSGRANVDCVKLTPSHVTLLEDLGLTSTPIRLAILGGEALTERHVAILKSLNPAMRIVNEYGPTETTVGCMEKEVRDRITIGRPIDGTTIRILDRRGRAMPIGIPGEIVIEGGGVARGFGGVYRSGDLGRRLADGEIEYLGRRDDQVKVRGHRVELGEIEARLEQSVRRAVVLLRDERLIAWTEGAPDVDALRAELPPWMIPSQFIEVDAMPLTVNGKIDKARLPEPDRASSDDPPRDALEARILALWRDVLGAEHIGIHDSFFEIGGHSLKAMQVMARLNARVRLSEFLTRPTIAALADAVRAATPSPYASIPPAPPREHYALSHAQQRLWLLHRMKGDAAYNMPRAWRYEGDLDVDALRASFARVVARHEALRTGFEVIGGEPRQVIHADATLHLREVDLRDERDPESAALAFAEREAVTPFDLAQPPLLRVHVLRLAEESLIVLLAMHHIVGDGWTMNILHRELAGESQSPLRIQYKDFAEWQNAADFSRDEEFWRETLRGAPEALRLPTDFTPAEAERDFRGDIERLRLSDDAVRALRALAMQHGTTLSNATLACFARVLQAISRQDDFCIGVSVANRSHPELEPLIGFFVNILPIRVRGGDDLDAIAARVYDAFDHQDYPFDLLVRALNPGRVANRQPLLNVVYAFQNFADVNATTHDDAFRDFPIAFRTSKFDVCLFVSQVGGGLLLELEYDTGLFRASTIRRILDAIERAALGLPLFEAVAIESTDVRTEYPRDATVHALFAEVARKTPDAIAVAFERETLTYAQLDAESDRIAEFLRERGVQREELVAVLLDRSVHLVPALLGILKAGAAYLPLAGEMPYERIRYVLDDAATRVVISEKRYVGMLNKLQWDCAAFEAFLCIDSNDVHAEVEESGGLMAPEVWDYIANEAFDDISGGGWKSSYTGEWLSREVMDEYGDNILAKLAPLVTRESRVLEIGCASGISMFRLAPLVARYYGTDLSPGIVRWSEAEAARRGIESIRLATLAAHEIDRLDERGFDVIILNSVIECFTGHNYLRDVLRKAVSLLNDRGLLFLGNVWDQDLKRAFIASLAEFKRAHPEEAKHAKLDRAEELFVSRGFLEDLRHELPIAGIEYSTMLGSAESELSQFGFDAIVRIDKRAAQKPATRRKREQFDARALSGAPASPPADAGASSLPPAALAYLIYTSGTSGHPKGTMIEHRSIIRLVRNTNYIELTARDRILQAGSLAFDASTFEIWGPLLNGGCVVLPAGKSYLLASDLANVIREQRVTKLFLTTMLFNQIVDDDVHALEGLDTLLVGGEKLSPATINRARQALPSLRLVNVYGPTENTTFSTFHDIAHTYDGDIPIGRPIANTTARILDDELRPVPPGIPGELCLGGDGLSRGYLHDDALTRAKFIEWNGERLYRTGDLVRLGASGAIEFLGRTDTQVKLRGFRIELEEIETALRRHAGVLDAAVLATERNGETTLVAFVRGDFDVDPLRATVRALLPEAMVPGEIVKMDKFPLNANGKVDRKALRVPVLRANDSDAVAPATTTEVALTELWERVLGQRGIGVTTDFFDAGGHSLKVARLVSLIQNDMNVHVPLTVVFRAPTVRELASYIDDARRFDLRLVDDVLVKMNRVDGAPAVFAFPPGSGYCLAYLRLAELLPVPFYGFGFIDDDQRLDEYVRRIVETAPAPYTLFGYSSGGKLAFRVAQELESRGHDVANVVILDSARYLRTVQFNDADIREIAAELLESVTSRVLREKTLARMRRYRAYIGELVESGTIAADLHLITAHDSREIPGVATLDGWRALTTGAFQRIEGSGAHREMLQPPHVETNAALLRAIFTPVLTEA